MSWVWFLWKRKGTEHIIIQFNWLFRTFKLNFKSFLLWTCLLLSSWILKRIISSKDSSPETSRMSSNSFWLASVWRSITWIYELMDQPCLTSKSFIRKTVNMYSCVIAMHLIYLTLSKQNGVNISASVAGLPFCFSVLVP